MRETERRERKPWAQTEPMWGEREAQQRAVKRYNLPENVKEHQAQELKRRFSASWGKAPPQGRGQNWKAWAFWAVVIAWACVKAWKAAH